MIHEHGVLYSANRDRRSAAKRVENGHTKLWEGNASGLPRVVAQVFQENLKTSAALGNEAFNRQSAG